MKATIDKITVTVGEQTLTFTLAEAEAMRNVLNEKLGEPVQKVVVKEIVRREIAPVFPPAFWRQGPVTPDFPPYTITCESQSRPFSLADRR